MAENTNISTVPVQDNNMSVRTQILLGLGMAVVVGIGAYFGQRAGMLKVVESIDGLTTVIVDQIKSL